MRLWTDYIAVSRTGDIMRVQLVIMPSGVNSATLLNQGTAVEPVEQFLAHLTAIERSPNTVRAYAHDLRDFFTYLHSRGLDWTLVTLEDLGKFVAWLRLPRSSRSKEVILLPWVDGSISASTVNRKLSALASFYEFHHRNGSAVGDLLTRWRPGGRGGSWKPFLAHLGSRPERHQVLGLKADKRVPRELSSKEITALIGECDHLRDKFLLTLLWRTGMRIGEVLGLRHEDINARRCEVTIRQRQNVNGARVKSWSRQIPVPPSLIRLYSDYLHNEYGDLDCDYVFVNLWGKPLYQPMSYASVDRLARRLRDRLNIEFTPHYFRHSYATSLLRCNVAPEIVQKLLGHASITTTIDTYSHLDIEDARHALVVAGIIMEDQRETVIS